MTVEELLDKSIGKREWQDDTPLLGDIDSLALVGLITQMEETFGFTPSLEELEPEDFETVGSLKLYVKRNVGA